MKKGLFLSLILFGLVGGLRAQTTPANPPAATRLAVDVPCIQAAIDRRETAIGTAYQGRSSAIITALEARKIALREAWSKATRNERVTARNNAIKTFNTATRTAKQAYLRATRLAWTTFTDDKEDCRVGRDANEGLGNDQQL